MRNPNYRLIVHNSLDYAHSKNLSIQLYLIEAAQRARAPSRSAISATENTSPGL